MNLEQYLKYLLEINSDDNVFRKDHFNKLSTILFTLFSSDLKASPSKSSGERIKNIELISQKFLLHISSIKKILEGVNLESQKDDIKILSSDPFSILIIVRAALETYLVLNYLSNRFNSEDMLQGRYEIWMRYGLKQRNIMPENLEEAKVSKNDKRSILTLSKQIKKKQFYKDLSTEKQKTFLKEIDKNWKIIIDGNKFYPASWKTLLISSGLKDSLCENLYNYLSWHAHTQSISILQLKDMWNGNFDKISIDHSLMKINMLTAFLISDISVSQELFQNAFNNLDDESKRLVNSYNISYRGEKYLV